MPQECSGEGKEVALAFLLFKNVLEGFVSVGCSRWCVYICCYCCCCLLSLVPWSQHEDAAREQLQGHTAHLVLRQWRHMCLQPNETIAIVIAASCGHNSPTGCRSRTAVMTVREQCSFPESMALLWSMASASCLRMLRARAVTSKVEDCGKQPAHASASSVLLLLVQRCIHCMLHCGGEYSRFTILEVVAES